MTTSPTTQSEPNENRRSLTLLGLHVLTLSCLAFTHPLLDLLGRSAEFLVIRRLDASGVFGLLAVLLFVVPLPILIVTLALERYGRAPGRVLNALIIGALTGLIVLRIEAAGNLVDGVAAFAVAIAAGLALGFAWHSSGQARGFLTWLSPALLVVPLLFLLQPGVRRAMFASDEGQVIESTGAKSPIVFLVFDELSLPSVIDQDGLVDADRYPHLAALAADSTWYRNAYTVADTTNIAVPAMLTSRFPRPETLPLLADHPKNIFTLFGGDYRIRAGEPITRLCPPSINELQGHVPSGSERVIKLGSDLTVVWLHLVLPASYRSQLPSIANTWEGFGAGGPGRTDPEVVPSNSDQFFALAVSQLSKGGRAEDFREFLAGIGEQERVLYFKHVLLPHVSWDYLPSGKTYTGDRGQVAGLKEDLWLNEQEPVRLAEVRYLMQVEFVDRLIGELMETLERKGIYDESLIVVVADHGASFRPGDQRRAYSETNAADILPVPLWIKAPGQKDGEVVDAHVTILDILPTMLDLLEVDVPWQFDGRPTRSLQPGEEREFRVSTKYQGELTISAAELDVRKEESARRLSEVIGPSSDPYRVGRAGPHPELLGAEIGAMPIREEQLWAALRHPAIFHDYDPHSDTLPLVIEGAVRPKTGEVWDLAIAVNGRIAATTRSFSPGRGVMHAFTTILPEHLIQPGFNDVQIFRIVEPVTPDGQLVLARTADRLERLYALTSGGDGRGDVLTVDGVALKMERLGTRLDGWSEGVDREDDVLQVHGWAVDVRQKGPPDQVVVFYRGRCIAAGRTWLPRENVVEAFGEPGYLNSGFLFDVPLSAAPDVATEGVRIFAFSEDGHATELGVLFVPLEDGSKLERILVSDGRTYTLGSTGLDGWVEAIRPERGGTLISGWAADLEKRQPADRIIVYNNGQFFTQAVPTGERSDILPDGQVLRCHFGIHVDIDPEVARNAIVSGGARFFAISREGGATELKVAVGR